MGLTAKQQLFVNEYLLDLNGKQAAIRAGYSEKSAEVQASRLLSNAKVAEAVEERQAEIAARLEVTQERIVAELAKIGFGDIRSLFDDSGRLKRIEALDDAAAATLSSIEVTTRRVPGCDRDDPEYEDVTKVRLWDKRAALVDLGKHLGMFKERGELAVTVRHEDALNALR